MTVASGGPSGPPPAVTPLAGTQLHSRIEEDDLLYAERGYSEDMLLATTFEITDTNPQLEDVLFAFQAAPPVMAEEDTRLRLLYAGVEEEAEVKRVVELLIWYGFLGVMSPMFGEVKYSYNFPGNMRRLLLPLEMADSSLVIHRAFRSALDVEARE